MHTRCTSLYEEICDFCKIEKIRFGHILKNDKFSYELKVCRHCAEKLIKDSIFLSVEQKLEARHIRKVEFIRTGWVHKRNGNLVKRINGNVITIFPNRYDTDFCIGLSGHIYKGYNSVIKSKWAAFDLADGLFPMGVY